MDFVIFDIVIAVAGIVAMIVSNKQPVRMTGMLVQALGFGLLVEDSLMQWTSVNRLLVLVTFIVVTAVAFLIAVRLMLTPRERKSFWQFSFQRLRGR